MTQQFAYGYWTVAGVACPITSADVADKSFALEVAELFDEKVSEAIERDESQGVVSYETAQKQWKEMKSTVKANKENPTDKHHKHKHEEMYDIITEVENRVFQNNSER